MYSNINLAPYIAILAAKCVSVNPYVVHVLSIEIRSAFACYYIKFVSEWIWMGFIAINISGNCGYRGELCYQSLLGIIFVMEPIIKSLKRSQLFHTYW